MPQSFPRSLPGLGAAMLLATLAGCGGSGASSNSAATPPASSAPVVTPPTTTLSLSSASDSAVSGGAPVQLTAAPSDNSSVTWSLAAGSPGTLSAATGATVSYLPPASGVSADTAITITATANGVSKTITLTLHPADTPRLQLLAGDDGGAGHLDGTGTQARLYTVFSASSDSNGNIYIAEQGPALRKVTPAGVVTTLLATAAGLVDGAGGTARLGQPLCPVAGPDGSVYFTDTYQLDSNAPTTVPIRKLAPDGSVATIARIPAAAFDQVCLTGDSNRLYAYQYGRISTVSFSGVVSTLAGALIDPTQPSLAADGAGAAARFRAIRSVAADGLGNVYVNDNGQAIRKVAADGTTTTLAGVVRPQSGLVEPVDGVGAAAQFSDMYSLAVTTSGNLAAYDNVPGASSAPWRLRTITPSGVVSSIKVNQGGAIWAAPADRLYRAQDAQIDMVQADGSSTPFVGKRPERGAGDTDGTGAAARFGQLRDMGADASGNLYVADDPAGSLALTATGLRLRKVTPQGVVTTIRHSADVSYLSGMVVDKAGNTYVSTYQYLTPTTPGARIFKIAPDGTTTVLAGALPATDYQDGVGTAAHFVSVALIGIDADGNLYGSEGSGARLRYTRITPAGEVSTILAPPPALGLIDDDAGNTYRINDATGTILRTDTAGNTTTMAGTEGNQFTYGGALPGYLDHPAHLVRTGPYSYALFSGAAIMRLTVPH
ncbi:hypothetical protein [Duganella callida]|uniref:Uncharacterized protein n=1 Tax=Duganella callida TaxID=2561932 RepID=A0A4Y9SBU6_9BURK|nr:hypothetical protein [Duganella callida]TFW19644.1 hypothetical protein E4L98_15855 [Duganella callida]